MFRKTALSTALVWALALSVAPLSASADDDYWDNDNDGWAETVSLDREDSADAPLDLTILHPDHNRLLGLTETGDHQLAIDLNVSVFPYEQYFTAVLD